MPGLLNAPAPATSPPPTRSNAIWSKKREDITFDQLQKFWSELPLQARQELLRIDKQAIYEQARKNLYCSRCNGLLPGVLMEIVTKQQDVSGPHIRNRTVAASETHSDSECEDVHDLSVNPWGGLVVTRDGMLTLLDCFISARSLKVLQKVFDNARAREHERELLFPDACGGGGRGWISQGLTNYGRGHGTRETCALHTSRLSSAALVEFWTALGEEKRTPLLRMKEEDFIERLMYRFDSKRFCRDCRRNVIREFKELKELKRMRRELRCTSWFCVADTAFHYEVSQDTVQADWRQSFTETVGTYHHFEWAIGTGEGKCDILEFEDVGMNGKVHVNGLDLGGLNACFITLRAWKLDGRCTEFCVKAHALNGQPCVHRRLMIGDGLVTITVGESIGKFFEHAEEAEEEEDDDGVDRDGNEIDADGSRPQKHAKSPELAREFLLDAATVIFKEQVEKAYREGIAQKNSSKVFVTLAVKLLEDRVHVACKEIITLEKQIKLLEEEEKEKREEEERRERRRTKEREKKLRRKERLKGKGRDKEREQNESSSLHVDSPTSSTHDELSPTIMESGDSVSDPGDVVKDEDSSQGCIDTKNLTIDEEFHVRDSNDEEFHIRDSNGSFILEQSKSSKRKLRLKKDSLLGQAFNWHDESDTKLIAPPRLISGGHRPLRERVVRTNPRNFSARFSEKFQCSSSRSRDRHEFISCSCSQNGDYRTKDSYPMSTNKPLRDIRTANKTVPTFYRGSKYSFIPENCVFTKGKASPVKEILHTRQVWEPLDSRRKGTKINSDSYVNPGAARVINKSEQVEFDKTDNCCSPQIPENLKDDRETSCGGFVAVTKSDCYSIDRVLPVISSSDPIRSSSSSDNCSSCLSEGDSSTCSSRAQNAESSSTSDSEDASPQSEGSDNTSVDKCRTNAFTGTSAEFEPQQRKSPPNSETGCFGFGISPQNQHVLPMHTDHRVHVPVFSSAVSGYHSQSAVSWYPQPSHFVFPPNPFSYEFGVHYNPLHTVTAPLLNARHHSPYETNNGYNNFSTVSNVSSLGSPLLEKQIPLKPTPNGQNRSASESSSFSLFHFGGPVPGVSGFNANLVPLKENAAAAPDANISCAKEDTSIEEYSLFSAGNGARFSFF